MACLAIKVIDCGSTGESMLVGRVVQKVFKT